MKTMLQVMLLACLAAGSVRAAGWADPEVTITNLTVVPRDERTAIVRFDFAREASWRHEFNHDAAWVFFKVRTEGDTEWRHVRLAADRIVNPTGFGQEQGGASAAIPGAKPDTPLEFLVPAGTDGFTGMFVRRAEIGEGPVKANGVTAVVELNTKGPPLPGSSGGTNRTLGAEIRAFGIEMVYVPEGAFSVGTGGTESNAFYRFTDDPNQAPPFRVTSAGAIPTGKQKGRLWAHGAEPEDGGEIAASFPNGFSAFYCMKHQVTPRQYAAYLNMLTPEQAHARYLEPAEPTKVHYSGGWGSVSRDEKTKPPTYVFHAAGARAGPGLFGVSWADGAAFAAWAGLRPMTELELEKAVRGPRKPEPEEIGESYWGVGGFNDRRWNAFKGDPQSERTVTVANATGRKYTGTHGNGTLTLPSDWPQEDAVGSGMRCTHYQGKDVDLPRARLSDRLLADTADPSRLRSHKWRGVRTAPREAAEQGSLQGKPKEAREP